MERRRWAISLKRARFAGLFLRLRNSSLFVVCFVSGTRIGSRHRKTRRRKSDRIQTLMTDKKRPRFFALFYTPPVRYVQASRSRIWFAE